MRMPSRIIVFAVAIISPLFFNSQLSARVYDKRVNIITTDYDLLDTTYIDRGRVDGVRVGDRFKVTLRDGKTITDAVVTATFDRMASVKIVDSWLLKDGQTGKFQQRPQVLAMGGRMRRPAPEITIATKQAGAPAAAAAAAPAAPAPAPAAPASTAPAGVPDLQGAPIIGGAADAGLPAAPGAPDAGLPAAPGAPDAGLPPAPGAPDAGLPPADAGLPPAPGAPDAGLPPAPGAPDAGLPPADAGLPPAPGAPDAGLPPAPGAPDAGLPPAPGAPDAGLPPMPDAGGAPSLPSDVPPPPM